MFVGLGRFLVAFIVFAFAVMFRSRTMRLCSVLVMFGGCGMRFFWHFRSITELNLSRAGPSVNTRHHHRVLEANALLTQDAPNLGFTGSNSLLGKSGESKDSNSEQPFDGKRYPRVTLTDNVSTSS